MSYSVTHYIVTASFGYTQRNTQNFKCPISLRSKPLSLAQSAKPLANPAFKAFCAFYIA